MKNKLFISLISFVLVISIFVCCFSFSASAVDPNQEGRIIDYSQYTNAFISVGVDGNKSIFYNYTNYNYMPFDRNDGISAFYDLQTGYQENQVKNDMLTYQYLDTISGSYPNRVWGGRVWFSNNYSGYQNKSLSSFQTAFLTIPRNYTLQYRLNVFLPAITYEQALKLQGDKVSITFNIGPNADGSVESKCSVDYIGTYRYHLSGVPYNQGITSPSDPLGMREGVFVSFIGSVSFSQRSTINSATISITGLDHNWSGLLTDRMILFTQVFDDSIVGRIGSFFGSIGSSIGGFFTNLTNNIGSFFSNLWNNLYNSLTNVTDWLYDIWHDTSVWLSNMTTNIGGFFTTLWSNISSSFNSVITIISAPFKSFLEPIIDVIANTLVGFFSLVRELFVFSSNNLNALSLRGV